MEKLTFHTLSKRIVSAIRERAATIPDSVNGSILLVFRAFCPDAMDFVGIGDETCVLTLDFPIVVGESRVRPAGWRKDEFMREVDCSGYAYAKVRGCAYALKNNLGRRSCDATNESTTFGRVNSKGCIAYDVMITRRFGIGSSKEEYLPYFRLYVSVSCATGKEDEFCALAAGDILRQWCQEELDDDGFGHMERYLFVLGPDGVFVD